MASGKFMLKFRAIMRAETFTLLLVAFSAALALDCVVLLQDAEITNIDWNNLEQCLGVANSENISRKMSANVWRLIKIAFDGIENIPAEVYDKIRLILTVIPVEELRNISMMQVEVVEAFGSVRRTTMLSGFNDQQIDLIAQKVRAEWLGKRPQTYSEYDLMTLGEILCHLNASDIAHIHADAFRLAAELIGSIESCPPPQLQALAQLAMRAEAFGEPRQWTKIDVSVIGNIINGLSQAELATLDPAKLHLNRYYVQKHKTNSSDRTIRKHHKNQSVDATMLYNFEDDKSLTRAAANKSNN